MRYMKIIFSLILINVVDQKIASVTYEYYLIIPLTFLSLLIICL